MLVTLTICNTLCAIMITMSKVRYQMKAKERAIWWNYATNACYTYQLVEKWCKTRITTMSGSEKLWYYNQLTYDTVFITVWWPVELKNKSKAIDVLVNLIPKKKCYIYTIPGVFKDCQSWCIFWAHLIATHLWHAEHRCLLTLNT